MTLEDILGLEPHKYKEGEPEWIKPDVMDFQGHGLVQAADRDEEQDQEIFQLLCSCY